MKSIQNLLPIAVAILVLSACGKDETDVNLNVQLTYGDEPMVMFKNYTYPTGETFFLSRVNMYVANVTLGDNVLATEDYYDFTESHSSAELATEGFTTTLGTVESDNYSALSFGLGVTPENNAMLPGDFPSTSVLSQAGEYWSGWESYVFYKIEGLIDTDGDGSFETGMSLHIGGDETYRNISIPLADKIDSDNNTIQLELDILEVFGGDDNTYDITNKNPLHNKNNHLPFMIELVDNTTKAISLK